MTRPTSFDSEIQLWNGQPGQVWLDADGDVGLLDHKDYSIILSPQGAKELQAWLNARFPPATSQRLGSFPLSHFMRDPPGGPDDEQEATDPQPG